MWNDIFNDIFEDVWVAEATAPTSNIFNDIFGPIFNDIWASPASGTTWVSVTLTDPLAPVGERVAGSPDIVAGDIIEYSAVTGTGEFVVYPDGSYAYDDTITGFTYRIYSAGVVGNEASISFVVLPMVITPFSNIVRNEEQEMSIAIADNILEADFITVTGIPVGSGLSYTNGTISGILNSVDVANSPYMITVSASNPNGDTVSSFTVSVAPAIDFIGIHLDALYRPNSDVHVAPMSGVSAIIYDALGGSKLWEGSVDITDNGIIIDTSAYTSENDSVFLITRWTESSNEFTYAGTETITDLST